MNKIILSVIALFILAGCGGSLGHKIVINEKYNDVSMEGRTVLIPEPFADSVIVLNEEDVLISFENMSGKPEEIIRDTLHNFIFNKTKHISTIKLDAKKFSMGEFEIELASDYFMVEQQFEKNDAVYYFKIPNKGFLESMDFNPDIIIIINKVVYTRGSLPTYKYNPPDLAIDPKTKKVKETKPLSDDTRPIKSNINSPFLVGLSEFIIWDYKNNEFICWGVLRMQGSFNFGAKSATWEKTFEQLVEGLYSKTPFYLRGGR